MLPIKISVPDWCYYAKIGPAETYYATLKRLGVDAVEMVPPERHALARAAGLAIINQSGPGMLQSHRGERRCSVSAASSVINIQDATPLHRILRRNSRIAVRHNRRAPIQASVQHAYQTGLVSLSCLRLASSPCLLIFCLRCLSLSFLLLSPMGISLSGCLDRRAMRVVPRPRMPPPASTVSLAMEFSAGRERVKNFPDRRMQAAAGRCPPNITHCVTRATA